MEHPVEKNNDGEYFVSMEFHLEECGKYEQVIKEQKKYIRFLKDKNKELEEENFKIKEQAVKILNELKI